MDKVRLGVIGYGNMGTDHCRNVYSGKVPGMELHVTLLDTVGGQSAQRGKVLG